MFTQSMTVGMKLTNGIGLTLVGMGVVFISLILISIALDVLRYVTSAPGKSGGALKPSQGPDTGSPVSSAGRIPATASAHQEIVAAISAAVSAYTGSKRFVIRSIRPRMGRFSLWRLAGRRHQMNDRLNIQDRKGKRA